jgi:hypothetical protein
MPDTNLIERFPTLQLGSIRHLHTQIQRGDILIPRQLGLTLANKHSAKSRLDLDLGCEFRANSSSENANPGVQHPTIDIVGP